MHRTCLKAMVLLTLVPVHAGAGDNPFGIAINEAPSVIDGTGNGVVTGDGTEITVYRGHRKPRNQERWEPASGSFDPGRAFSGAGDCNDPLLGQMEIAPLP